MGLIPVEASANEREAGGKPAEEWCRKLEEGNILFFPRTPIAVPPGDLEFLLSSQQSQSGLHKNIAYKPGIAGSTGTISGLDRKAAGPKAHQRLHSIMEAYSQAVEHFLSGFLSPYRSRWRLDYASYRPREEQGRDLPLRRRNDLLHTDAFPTRPTGGARILRFFNNIHPARTRDWIVSDPFAIFIAQYSPSQIPLPSAEPSGRRKLRRVACSIGLGELAPSLKRTPYDAFMMRLHNSLKENAEFQRNSPKYPLQFPPGSSWMVYTDMVPHAVLSGQYALEQTLLVDRQAMVAPEHAPLTILESMTKASLA